MSALLIVCLLAQLFALAGQQTQNSTAAWDAVRSIPVASELEINLADGKSVKGRQVSADDSEIVLSLGKAFKHLPRHNVKRVYVIASNPRGSAAAKEARLVAACYHWPAFGDSATMVNALE